MEKAQFQQVEKHQTAIRGIRSKSKCLITGQEKEIAKIKAECDHLRPDGASMIVDNPFYSHLRCSFCGWSQLRETAKTEEVVAIAS